MEAKAGYLFLMGPIKSSEGTLKLQGSKITLTDSECAKIESGSLKMEAIILQGYSINRNPQMQTGIN